MNLDVNTLFLVTIYVEAILGLLLLFAWIQDKQISAVAWWGCAHLLRAMRENLASEDLTGEVRHAIDNYVARKIVDFEEVIVLCLGLELECLSERSRINPEQDLPCVDAGIVGDVDANDTARNVGGHADHIGLYDRLR